MNSLCVLLISRFLEHKINPMKLLQGNLTSHFFFFLDESFIFKIGMGEKKRQEAKQLQGQEGRAVPGNQSRLVFLRVLPRQKSIYLLPGTSMTEQPSIRFSASSLTRRLISSCLSGADLAVAFIMVEVWLSVSFLMQRCPATMLQT